MEGQETDKSVCFLNAWTEQYHWMKGWKTSLISGHEFVELSWRFSQTIYFLRASTRHSAYVRSSKALDTMQGFFFLHIISNLHESATILSWYQYLFRHYWYYWNEDRKKSIILTLYEYYDIVKYLKKKQKNLIFA